MILCQSQPETECETDGEEDLVSFHLGGLGVSSWQSVILLNRNVSPGKTKSKDDDVVKKDTKTRVFNLKFPVFSQLF